jgi:hypothetical protein
MSNLLKVYGLRADLGAARGMLVAAREYHEGLAIRQFEYRVRMLQDRLDNAVDAEDPVATATLFFGGKSFPGHRGIDLSFGNSAMELFRHALCCQFVTPSTCIADGMEAIAQIKSRLAITARVRGSVCFVLEEDSEDNVRTAGLSEALDDLTLLLSQLAIGNSVWETPSSPMNSRVLNAVREWVELMGDAKASVRIVEGNRDLALSLEGFALARSRLT